MGGKALRYELPNFMIDISPCEGNENCFHVYRKRDEIEWKIFNLLKERFFAPKKMNTQHRRENFPFEVETKKFLAEKLLTRFEHVTVYGFMELAY